MFFDILALPAASPTRPDTNLLCDLRAGISDSDAFVEFWISYVVRTPHLLLEHEAVLLALPLFCKSNSASESACSWRSL